MEGSWTLPVCFCFHCCDVKHHSVPVDLGEVEVRQEKNYLMTDHGFNLVDPLRGSQSPSLMGFRDPPRQVLRQYSENLFLNLRVRLFLWQGKLAWVWRGGWRRSNVSTTAFKGKNFKTRMVTFRQYCTLIALVYSGHHQIPNQKEATFPWQLSTQMVNHKPEKD